MQAKPNALLTANSVKRVTIAGVASAQLPDRFVVSCIRTSGSRSRLESPSTLRVRYRVTHVKRKVRTRLRLGENQVASAENILREPQAERRTSIDPGGDPLMLRLSKHGAGSFQQPARGCVTPGLLVPGRRRLRALLARPRQASKQGGIEIRCALVLGGAGTASQRGQMSRQYSAERSRDMSRCSHGGDEPGSDVWNTAKQPAQSAAVVWNIAK